MYADPHYAPQVNPQTQQQKEKQIQQYYQEQQINGTIISPHGQVTPDYDYVQVDGKIIRIINENKIKIINKDLTSGFSTPEFQWYAFGTCDFLSKLVSLEADFGVDLTKIYNQEARDLVYSYAMSKSGGKAANIVKQHKVISEAYQVSQEGILPNQGGKSLRDFLPKGKVTL